MANDEEVAVPTNGGDAAGSNGEEPAFKKPRLPETKAPKSKKDLKFEDTYLRAIPAAKQYEKSFMHRDVITHVLATTTDFIVTASQDGNLKFWKKKHGEGVEFVKHFKCHLNAFAHLTVNHNGTLLATVCTEDKSAKIFDVSNFDMINMLTLPFRPSTAVWTHQAADIINVLAIADADQPLVHLFDGKGTNEVLHTIERVHYKPYSAALNLVVSGNYEFPEEQLEWKTKMDTDLYEYAKLQEAPKCLAFNPTGEMFAAMGNDRQIRVFNTRSGRIVKTIDESLQTYIDQGKANKNHGLPSMEWNRRVALEKELSKSANAFQFLKFTFDFSGNYLIYPTPLGISVYNLVTEEVVREIGKGENARFLAVSLCRALPDSREEAATSIQVETAENPNLRKSEPDPMLVACAHNKPRFYLFTNAEPYVGDEEEDGHTNRDVFNEKPLKEEAITAVEDDAPQSRSCENAIIHTTFGDIHVELFPDKCPRTVENFCTLARRGYYNSLMFHRVIKSFMIQTGDPTGKGTGGQSIYGHDFEDEFHPMLKHTKPYCLSMANAGPNSNGSQFFITVVPAEWLDGKNTLFGHVTEGFNVVQKINGVPCHEKSGRPREEIKIISITLKGE
ncbi:Cyclophilin-type peptidyl-prolyl cis-trans isomerase-15, Bmcyp-15 [Aphelenchoides fujianensis]|nr:Cyclophilin-type peptidyl-prolyl cis-trans isomerase-15, Bmcyp-15 [Aphelenchoides fujianensis]